MYKRLRNVIQIPVNCKFARNGIHTLKLITGVREGTIDTVVRGVTCTCEQTIGDAASMVAADQCCAGMAHWVRRRLKGNHSVIPSSYTGNPHAIANIVDGLCMRRDEPWERMVNGEQPYSAPWTKLDTFKTSYLWTKVNKDTLTELDYPEVYCHRTRSSVKLRASHGFTLGSVVNGVPRLSNLSTYSRYKDMEFVVNEVLKILTECPKYTPKLNKEYIKKARAVRKAIT